MRVHLAKGRWLVEVSETDVMSIAVPSNDDVINREFDRYTQESKDWHSLQHVDAPPKAPRYEECPHTPDLLCGAGIHFHEVEAP